MNKADAIRYMIKHPSGNVKVLCDIIGEERFREFNYLEYIVITAGTYRITSYIKLDYDAFYKTPGFLFSIKSILFGLMAKIFEKL